MWLDRMLVESPVPYAICFSERQFKELCKGLNIQGAAAPRWILNDRSGATTHYFTQGAKVCAIVCVDLERSPDENQTLAIIVHEAMHVWREIRQNIGEREPSSEFEAYSMQRLCLSMFDAYSKHNKNRRKKK